MMDARDAITLLALLGTVTLLLCVAYAIREADKPNVTWTLPAEEPQRDTYPDDIIGSH